MAKNPRKAYGTMPPQRFDGVILQLKKGGAAQALMLVFTKQTGWIRVFAPKGKRALNQGIGGFFPLSEITFNAWERDGVFSLGEYESKANKLMADMTFDGYVYSQIFIEMLFHLLPEHERDQQVYELLCYYSRALEVKDARILTIIAGWQLVSIAGFRPDVEQVMVYRNGVDNNGEIIYSLYDEPQELLLPVTISDGVRKLWNEILEYAWDSGTVLKVNVRDIAVLEKLLFDYVQQCSDRALKSVELLFAAKEK